MSKDRSQTQSKSPSLHLFYDDYNSVLTTYQLPGQVLADFRAELFLFQIFTVK